MGKSSLKDKACALITWALMMTYGAAEQEYFPQSNSLTWDEARHHCQVCFKDLVTLTPDNIRTITQNLTSEHWVGLRKNRSSTGNFSMVWSRWANGDPLFFQNWYPGWPVLKSSLPKRVCCSCSCTCPSRTTAAPTTTATAPSTSFTGFTTQNVTSFSELGGNTTADVTDFTTLWESGTQNSTGTIAWTDFSEFTTAAHVPVSTTATDAPDNTTATDVPDNTTATDVPDNTTATDVPDNTTATHAPVSTRPPPVVAECVSSPLLPPEDPETDENYIEDSCVVMLSSGTWVERKCTELLPFICYEDRFIGEVTVTNVTSTNATLAWLRGPGYISHYRLHVKGDKDLTMNLTNLTFGLDDLTPGTSYTVLVFPVKCERDLNPQVKSFYTTPDKVQNLIVTSETETSIALSWNKPAGNVDFYHVEVQGQDIQSNMVNVEGGTLNVEIGDLTPGSLYTSSVRSEVKDKSKWSEESTIATYTRPGQVSNLTVSKNTVESLLLSWEPPKGRATGFRVKAVNDNDDVFFDEVVNRTENNVTGLPMATRITLSVTALANASLEGDTVTVVSYTAPGPISNLTLVTTHDSLTATWSAAEHNDSHFVIELQLDGEGVNQDNLTEPRKHFGGLKTAAKYTVIVYVVTGHLKGPSVGRSKYTLPQPPTDLKAIDSTKDQITLQWKAPANTARVSYLVRVSSSFWGQSWSYSLDNKTSHTFSGLTSGTRYKFEVQTVAGGNSSNPESVFHSTVAEVMEISLSMLCSSAEVLHCDNSSTRESVFNQLRAHFNTVFGNSLFWELKQLQSGN